MFIQRHFLFRCCHKSFLTQREPDGSLRIFYNIPWLRQHGLLGQMPRDPQGIGLNVAATGAHRVAAEMGSNFHLKHDDQQDMDHYLSLTADLLRQFARDSYGDLDKCVCWCNSDGDGCSPLKLLYKSHAHPRELCVGIEICDQYGFQSPRVTRLLFGFDIFEDPTTTPTLRVKRQREREQVTDAQPSTRALELVLFLTFEALEMTHTCCMLEKLDTSNLLKVILNCNPRTVRDIRQSEVERRNAAFLNTLMEEFSNIMKQDYQAKSLFDFIFGYWKTRIGGLYAVREEEVQKIQEHVNNVRTGIWPRPLRRLLWPRDWDDESNDFESVPEEANSNEDAPHDEHQEGEDRH
ncbi:hypothetical protein NCS56_00322600 [Fusarium sp. Ph1]|nr:hypothetical protein NCS56_00322600 [Fusarium sp. Ph1]